MLGNRIQRARKALGLSLREVAEQVALSHAAVKKYEDNVVVPSSDVLVKLAKVLHVKVEYFFRPQHFALANIQYRKHADMPTRYLEEIKIKILDQVDVARIGFQRMKDSESRLPWDMMEKTFLKQLEIMAANCYS